MVICMSKKSKKKEEQAPETQEAENQAPEKSEVKPAPKPPREAEPLRIFFTVLLILVGAAELALWGYLGFSVYQSIQTQRTNHTQQGVSQTAGRAGYIGPGLMLENGAPVDLPPTEDSLIRLRTHSPQRSAWQACPCRCSHTPWRRTTCPKSRWSLRWPLKILRFF